MWPIKRKKKSARKDLKQVYYYKNDFIMLKGLSKEQNRSMTQTAHDVILVYLGYKHGISTAEIETEIEGLKFKLGAIVEEHKKVRNELKLYKERYGEIFPSVKR